jgi:LPPG:FO 2-phospho-L-lactate transferase
MNSADAPKVLALAGGVGGAKLALGLSRVLAPERLTVVVNTGDDEEFYGLHVSPDLDTVMYTLAGLANPETGWGLRDETFTALEAYERLGGDAWFGLGDRDLGTHLRRTELLRVGWPLSAITAELCRRLGVQCAVAPMTDERVRTIASTDEGELAFQEYFVHRRCEPVVLGLRFDGIGRARPSSTLDRALNEAALLVVCPSNPFVSIGPILAIPGVRDRIAGFDGTRAVVSPIIAGEAVKGPAAKMLAELGEQASAPAVARHYQGLCDIFVLDDLDASLAPEITALGMRPLVTRTLMLSDQDKTDLARRILDAAVVD